MKTLPVAIAGAWLILVAGGCGPAGRSADSPPNIVVVIADDQSWRDYGFMGSEVAQTPHLDALAESGTVFTHAFTTASACRPSLRTLLTGLEPERLAALETSKRIQREPFPELAAVRDVDTLPRLLAARGYASFQGGKHWEGRFDLSGFGEGTALGFDAAKAAGSGGLIELAGGDGTELGRSTLAPLLDFVTAHADEPFLLWFAPMLPHTPHDPPAEWLERHARSDLSPEALRYFGNVSRLDAAVGALLAKLDALGLREHTLVLFLADNGWDASDEAGPVHPELGGPHGKFSVYENGFRTPMIVSWPGTLPAGIRDDALVSSLDVMPTLLDFAGLGEPLPGRSGLSLRARLEARAPLAREQLIGSMDHLRVPPDELAEWALSPVRPESGYFLRAPGWRYVWMPRRRIEALYAIDDDPWEQHDLASEHPERVRRARAAVEAWKQRMRVAPPMRGDGTEPGQPSSST